MFVCLFYNFAWLFLAVLGLRCCVGFPLVAVSGGCSPVVVHGLLTAVASLVGRTGSRACGLSSCGSQALECMLSGGACA